MIWRADDTTDFGYGDYLEKEWLISLEGVQYKLSSYLFPGLDLTDDGWCLVASCNGCRPS